MNLVLLAIGVTAVSVSLTALAFLLAGGRSPTETRLMEVASVVASGNAKYEVRNFIAKLTRPLAPMREWMKAFDEDLAHRLTLGGFRRPEHVDNFISAKLLCPLLGILLATFLGSNDWVLYALLLGAAGFFAPDIFLIRATARRKARISEALPDFIDLLIISIDAGLGIDQSVLKIANEIKVMCRELSEELLTISREQRAGKPRLDAWRSMADRTDLDIVRQFVGMLAQSEKFGTPVSRSLDIFADSLRSKRLLQAEEFGAKTAVKLIFPLVFCIFPALFVVLLGPAAISIMQAFD